MGGDGRDSLSAITCRIAAWRLALPRGHVAVWAAMAITCRQSRPTSPRAHVATPGPLADNPRERDTGERRDAAAGMAWLRSRSRHLPDRGQRAAAIASCPRREARTFHGQRGIAGHHLPDRGQTAIPHHPVPTSRRRGVPRGSDP
jgi:hypothetical protein